MRRQIDEPSLIWPRDSKGACGNRRRHPAIPSALDCTFAEGSHIMNHREISRRSVLQGGAALAGMALLGSKLPALATESQASTQHTVWSTQVALSFPTRPGEEVLPWIDQPAPNPVPDIVGNQLQWETLDSWITPNEKFFTIKHYAQPQLDPATWNLEVHGLVERPMTLSLADLRARPHQDVAFTIECSGNHGPPFTGGLIGNAVWTGTPLAALLQESGVLPDGSEVVFWGTETGPEDIGGVQVVEQFARSMSLDEAMDPRNILCWGMNGVDLPPEHGAPVRLIAPGWYGIANVKWLQRIEVLDRPYEGRFMAREYRTIRNEEREGQTLARITSVGHVNLKSAPAKVTRLGDDHRIIGVAWGGPIARVEVRIDDGAWVEATIEEQGDTEYSWVVWSLDWGQPPDGEHRVTTRAIDTDGNIQPTMDDPLIANKLTIWESNGQITRRVAIGAQHFPETGHSISGEFQTFWGQHGGLATFGYPLTEAFEEDGRTVQYFERQRFELHPENAAPWNVLLGLLGTEALDGGAHPPTEPADGNTCDYHATTGHNACGRFREVWQAGGLMIYGYPITEEFEEDGLTVQYFERARFEHHPTNQPPYDVLLGLLGYEALEARYGGNLPV
jgi:DMSO/TMAO reductase YedYZ molybdopterin-dependent catalytic subunit